MVKVSDYIFDYFLSKGIDTIFCVSGGAAAHLLNSVKEKNIRIIHMHHEQACAMAADAYARIAGKPAIVLVTNGPGSTNTITGVLGAYQDSIPMIVISGQVPTTQTLIKDDGLRQLGVQECDIIKIVKSITKYAKQLRYTNNNMLSYHISEAYIKAISGRQGPIWLDIPLDIQSALVDEKELGMFCEDEDEHTDKYDISHIVDLLLNAEKPLIVLGNGIHLSKTEELLQEFLCYSNIPVVTTWNAKDLFHYDNPRFIGSFGLMGERAGNFAIQNADLLLILGTRLSIPCIGYDAKAFSPKSTKIMVDIDHFELEKKTLNIHHKINEDLNVFFPKLIKEISGRVKHRHTDLKDNWNIRTLSWKIKYPINEEPHKTETDKTNSFNFIEELGKHLDDRHIVVTDMGTAFTCTMQALKMNGSRLFTSSGTSSMGFGLPGAIGAWIADPTKQVILIAGDGGFQMNIQELQTVKYYNIPLKMFVLNNNGYSAISLMQDNLFNSNYIGSTPESGVDAPNFTSIVGMYGISPTYLMGEYMWNGTYDGYWKWDELNSKYSKFVEIRMINNQPLFPKVQSSKDEKGNIISNALENMWPYLSENEMKEIMQ